MFERKINTLIMTSLIFLLLTLKVFSFCPHEHSHCMHAQEAACSCETDIHHLAESPLQHTEEFDSVCCDLLSLYFEIPPVSSCFAGFTDENRLLSLSADLEVTALRGPPCVS